MNYIDRLLTSLDSSINDSLGGSDVGVLFSGGIDSCVIAEIAKRHCQVTLYTIGMSGSHDLKVAEGTAERLGLEWNGIVMSEDDVCDGIKGLRKIFPDMSPLTISFEMPLYIVAKASKENVLASGQGADELFGGYARYERMSVEQRRDEMRKDVAALVSQGSPMERSLARYFGKVIVHPFLDPRVLEVALHIPNELVIDGGERKVALRQVARSMNLLEEAERKKKAAQYGSGVMAAMKNMARREGKDLRSWVDGLQVNGDGAQ